MSDDPGYGGDDLTRIAGIGSKTAQRLAAAGITTYAALAAHEPDDIIRLLPDVTGLSTARVDGWRDQARALQAAAAGAPPAAAGTPEDAAKNGQRYESFLVRILLNEDGSVRRTTVQHIRTGQERHWPRLDHAALPEFIESAIAAPPVAAATPAGALAETPAGQPSGPAHREAAIARRSGPASSAVLSVERAALRAGAPFTLTVAIDLAAPPPQATRLAYSAVVVARPMAGGPKRTLAQAEGLLPAASSAISIESAGLPSGTYRLDGAVSLREPGGNRPVRLAALVEGLLVQVVPG